jgi:hypothetical protein
MWSSHDFLQRRRDVAAPTPGDQKTPSSQQTRMIARITPMPPLGP